MGHTPDTWARLIALADGTDPDVLIDEAEILDVLLLEASLDEDAASERLPGILAQLEAEPGPLPLSCLEHRPVVDKNLAGGVLSPEDLATLAEIPDCESCRHVLDRWPHMDSATIDRLAPLPQALQVKVGVAVVKWVKPKPTPANRRRWWPAVGVAAAALVGLAVLANGATETGVETVVALELSPESGRIETSAAVLGVDGFGRIDGAAIEWRDGELELTPQRGVVKVTTPHGVVTAMSGTVRIEVDAAETLFDAGEGLGSLRCSVGDLRKVGAHRSACGLTEGSGRGGALVASTTPSEAPAWYAEGGVGCPEDGILNGVEGDAVWCELDYGVKHGPWKVWDSDGLVGEGGNRFGRPDGQETWSWANGNKKVRRTHVQGERIGIWTWWYEDGQIEKRQSWTKGEKDGTWTWWDPDGNRSRHGEWDMGARTGDWTEWQPNGTVRVATWEDGELVDTEIRSPR